MSTEGKWSWHTREGSAVEAAGALLLMLVVSGWLWEFFAVFNQENHRYAQGVCCGLIEPVLDAVQKMQRDEPIDFSKGYAGYVAARWLNYWAREPSALLWLSQTAHILSGWLMFAFGCRWRAPLLGAVSGTALLLTPVLLYTSLRWDIYALQGPLLVLAFWIGYGSKGFSSVLHCVLYAGVVWVSAFWSYRETDNLILLLTEAAMAFGFWTSALWFGKDSERQPIVRWQSALFGLMTCGVLLWWIAQYWRFTSPEGIQYYFREADNPMMESTVQLTQTLRWLGYWGHIYWRALGPWLAGLAMMIAAVVMMRRQLPWGLVFGILIPYAALSVISKRNFYYPSTLWVLIPIILGYGFRVIPHVWIRLLSASLITGVLGWSVEARREGAVLEGDDTYGGIFQTSDANLSLKATRLWGVDTLAVSILERLTTTDCQRDTFVVLEANAMMEEIALRLTQHQPCVVVKRNLQNRDSQTLSAVQVWVTDPKQHPTRESWLSQQGFEKREDLLMDNRFYLAVWSR